MWRHFRVDAAQRKSSKKATERTEDMAELSLYLTNVNVSLGQTMDAEKVKSFLNIISEVMEVLCFVVDNSRGISFYFLVR